MTLAFVSSRIQIDKGSKVMTKSKERSKLLPMFHPYFKCGIVYSQILSRLVRQNPYFLTLTRIFIRLPARF